MEKRKRNIEKISDVEKQMNNTLVRPMVYIPLFRSDLTPHSNHKKRDIR